MRSYLLIRSECMRSVCPSSLPQIRPLPNVSFCDLCSIDPSSIHTPFISFLTPMSSMHRVFSPDRFSPLLSTYVHSLWHCFSLLLPCIALRSSLDAPRCSSCYSLSGCSDQRALYPTSIRSYNHTNRRLTVPDMPQATEGHWHWGGCVLWTVEGGASRRQPSRSGDIPH
jgi:hypothetical protein